MEVRPRLAAVFIQAGVGVRAAQIDRKRRVRLTYSVYCCNLFGQLQPARMSAWDTVNME